MTFSAFPDTAIHSSKIWTTLITNAKYVPGVITLDYSLKKVGSNYPLVAMYTEQLDDESIRALTRRNIPIRKIHQLNPVESPELSADPRFADCWSKLYIFKLVEFNRVVELDSDMVVRQNMDELMEIPLGKEIAFGSTPACVCNPFGLQHYPKDWIPSNCSFTDYHEKKKQTVDPEDDYFDCKGPVAEMGLKKCNGGLIMIEPSLENYNRILDALQDPQKTARYQFPDQELLADVFEDHWLCLSYVYNSLKSFTACHKDIWDLEKIKNIHYIITPKPWNVKRGEYEDATGTFVHWWDVDDERRVGERERGIRDEYSTA
ncbi:DEKNAAC104255 [Brettanomyces naardenensis]|uniref:DEKNAAC104255 n=1 Tax=Brettanomyces naardenensis TaxID=13370 RepID=A0A448YPT9_BRENA|nr:DEKNAAC104255 [Brettanomyces naardenensis]